jgi:hypothetical protein
MPLDETLHLPFSNRPRLGFHYYPDTLHYRECDLDTCLPELNAMGAAWLTLQAPLNRAIPEPFLRGLLNAGIEPILHFRLPFSHPTSGETLDLLCKAYAAWGVHFITLFDRPNQRSSWPACAWTQSDLVERFLDLFIPSATCVMEAGLTPVFPPLEPGGDYWDTSFLQAALRGLVRRGQTALVDGLHLGAYAWVDEHPIDWGKGGPERWPGVRPYFTPEGEEDQRGFYIFEWYLAQAEAALGEARPILLLAAGNRTPPVSRSPFLTGEEEAEHARINLTLARRLSANGSCEPLSPYLLACNFWLLAADPCDPCASQAWFQPDGYFLPIVDELRRLAAGRTPTPAVEQAAALPWLDIDAVSTENGETAAGQPAEPAPSDESPLADTPPDAPQETNQSTPISSISEPTGSNHHPIAHYLLLPLHETGAAEWHLEAARPFILKYHPTVGYSLSEAALAEKVTIIGSEQVYTADQVQALRKQGCQVERIAGDGTEIATQLASA